MNDNFSKMDKQQSLDILNGYNKNTLMETLEIEFIDLTEDVLTARMPVTPRVHQPDGLLHGGASVALAESIGSAAAIMFLVSSMVFSFVNQEAPTCLNFFP